MPVFRISKTFSFDASHRLDGLPEGHKCGRLHGHTYSVEIELTSDRLDATGFVFDYGRLAPFKDWLDEHFDHRDLNDQVSFNPTAELLAEYLFGKAVGLLGPEPATGARISAMRVSETPKTMAEYRPDPSPPAERLKDQWAGIRP